jgi:uncharacterized iron-regulated membrane protein
MRPASHLRKRGGAVEAVSASISSLESPAESPAISNRWPGPRRLLLLLHRYTGLAIATFLVVAGVTGTFLAFYHELDAALNPRLFHVAAAEPLDPFDLRERLEKALPGRAIHWLPLDTPPGKSAAIWIDSGDPALDDEYFVDPHNGDILGSRRWGDLSQGIVLNAMPFLYRLHYSLALGESGSLLLGIVALLWTIDCFVGAWLTFPAGKTHRSASGALGKVMDGARRWKVSWLIKGGSLFRSLFTFHRAAGLWLWVTLFVFAWSAVGFNLRPVFNPVMKAAFAATDVWDTLPKLDEPRERPTLGWREAHTAAKRAMAGEAATRGFEIRREGYLQYLPDNGLYRYAVHSSFDLGDRWAGTKIWLDGNDGSVVGFDAPTGGSRGNTLASWLFALHMGTVGGLAYRIFVAVLGMAIAALSFTGVYIWWHKRRTRRRADLA